MNEDDITRIKALNLKEKKIDTNYRLYRVQNPRMTEYFGKHLFPNVSNKSCKI